MLALILRRKGCAENRHTLICQNMSELTILVLPGILFRNGLHNVPMLRYLSVSVKAEDVERYLFTRARKIVNGLKKYLVAVLKCANVVYGGFYGSGSKIAY